jgi:hypothetical protein
MSKMIENDLHYGRTPIPALSTQTKPFESLEKDPFYPKEVTSTLETTL